MAIDDLIERSSVLSAVKEGASAVPTILACTAGMCMLNFSCVGSFLVSTHLDLNLAMGSGAYCGSTRNTPGKLASILALAGSCIPEMMMYANSEDPKIIAFGVGSKVFAYGMGWLGGHFLLRPFLGNYNY